MGEYADEVVDALINSEESWSIKRPQSRPKSKTCKHCGQGGLWWHRLADGSWRLISYSNDTQMRRVLHNCFNNNSPELLEPDDDLF